MAGLVARTSRRAACTAFSPAAREAIARAAEEARLLDHAYVGTEHLLLGLLRDEKGAAGRVLADLHIRLGEARVQVERDRRAWGGRIAGWQACGSPLARSACSSWRCASRSASSKIDTGHVLLGIERDGEGVAMIVLERLGASRGLVRRCTIAMLAHDPVETPGAFAPPSTRAAFVSAEDEANALGHAWVGCGAPAARARSAADGPWAGGARGSRGHARHGAVAHARVGDRGDDASEPLPARHGSCVRSTAAEEIAR